MNIKVNLINYYTLRMRYKSYALKTKKKQKNENIPIISQHVSYYDILYNGKIISSHNVYMKYYLSCNQKGHPIDIYIIAKCGDYTSLSDIVISNENEIIYKKTGNETGEFLGDINKIYDITKMIVNIPPKELDMMN